MPTALLPIPSDDIAFRAVRRSSPMQTRMLRLTRRWDDWPPGRHIIGWSRSELGWVTNAGNLCVRDNGLGQGDWKLRPMGSQGVCQYPQAKDDDCDGVPNRLERDDVGDDHDVFPGLAPVAAGATRNDWSFPGPNHRTSSLTD
jgi:hypothetical protein